MSDTSKTVRLGTRGSLLAKTQSRLIASALEKAHSGLVVELVLIKTTGDVVTDKPLHELGGKGVFTKEIERALLDNQIDLAVHSFKDVPVTMPLVDQSNLLIAAVPVREDPRDVLISSTHTTLDALPQGAKVGTSSLRRRCQLLARRSDLVVQDLRGNIDTRLKKLRDKQYDAIILASAGLRRTGLFDEAEMSLLSLDDLLPAPGQGALALQCRKDDEPTRELLAPLNDLDTQTCIDAERAVVAALQGDCHSPIAAVAQIRGKKLHLRVAVGARDGSPPALHAQANAPPEQFIDAVDNCVKSLKDHGVMDLLAGGHSRL